MRIIPKAQSWLKAQIHACSGFFARSFAKASRTCRNFSTKTEAAYKNFKAACNKFGAACKHAIKNSFEKIKTAYPRLIAKMSKDHPATTSTIILSGATLAYGCAFAAAGMAFSFIGAPAGVCDLLWLSGTGMGMVGMVSAVCARAQYKAESRKNAKIETIENTAGQTVKGPRWALYRLLHTQDKISALTADFNTESLDEKTQVAIKEMIAKTDPARASVKIIENDVETDKTYNFIRTAVLTKKVQIGRGFITTRKKTAFEVG